jgi:hypothetical protein
VTAARRKRGGAARKGARAERRRWVVDSIGEGIATVEEDGERILRVPRWMLPDDAREGSVLSVTREAHDGDVALRIGPDAEGEAAALERSRRQVERETGDEGGDIAL